MLAPRPRAAAAVGAAARARLGASSPKRVSSTSASPGGGSDVSLLTAVVAGGVSGVLSGLSGVGGGMLLVPAVARVSKMPMQVINGTCYAGLTLSAGVGAWDYAGAGACNVALAALTALPAIAFSRPGVLLAQRLSSRRLSTVVGGAMLVGAPLIALKDTPLADKLPPRVAAWMEPPPARAAAEGPAPARASLDLEHFGTAMAHGRDDPEARRRDRFLAAATDEPLALLRANARYLLVGALSGFVSGLCGIGGSLLTSMYLTTATDMPQRTVVGTTLVSVLPMALATSYHNHRVGVVHVPTAARIGASLALAVHLTSRYVLTHPVPESFLRDVLSATVAAGAILTIRRAI